MCEACPGTAMTTAIYGEYHAERKRSDGLAKRSLEGYDVIRVSAWNQGMLCL